VKILGLNFGHDAGVSLIVDGVFACHWEKERHCRVKHAIGLRARDVAAALDYFGVSLEEIQSVAVTTTQGLPFMLYDGMSVEFGTTEIIDQERLDALIDRSTGFYARFENSDLHPFGHYLKSLGGPPDEEIRIREAKFPVNITRADADYFDLPADATIPSTPPAAHTIAVTLTLQGRRIPGRFVSHHLCHAYYAYSQLGRGNGLIVTFDGGPAGRFRGGGLYFGTGGRVVPIYFHNFFFGFFYEGVGQELQLGPVGAAGKLMGLAAWGNPVYYDAGLVGRSPYTRADLFEGEDGPMARRPLVNLWRSRMAIPRPRSNLRDCETPPQIEADIAASAQAMFTDTILAVVDAAIGIAKSARFSYDHIALSGGCALNCPANSAVFAKYGPRVFVPPAVNDEGISAGAGLCCASLTGDSILGGRERGPAEVAYKGIVYEAKPDLLAGRAGLLRIEVPNAVSFLAAQIARGAVIALFEGKAEIGPRALGHRSLIASPLIAANWKRVNAIKNREAWRPLAPVVLDTEFHQHFEGCPPDSYYMLFNAKVRGTHLPAVTHRDGTARVQVAVPECGFIYRLLEAFREETGVGVLLNTSFNGRGEPIVETPTQALDAFTAMPIDLLYLQGILVGRLATSVPDGTEAEGKKDKTNHGDTRGTEKTKELS